MAANFNVNILVRNGHVVLLLDEQSGSISVRLSLSSKQVAHFTHELDRANHALLVGAGEQYVCRPGFNNRKEKN